MTNRKTELHTWLDHELGLWKWELEHRPFVREIFTCSRILFYATEREARRAGRQFAKAHDIEIEEP